jgi:ribosomal protein S18 acetylase RimI-like enzyme
MGLVIREYQPGDAAALRHCVIVLQEFERLIDSRLRPGEAMADAYCEQVHNRCRTADGRVFVAEEDRTVVGFVAVLAHEKFTELDDPPGTYALVTDLVVPSAHRGRGIAQQLLERAEGFVRTAGARELRIGVLADNIVARRLYLRANFVPHQEVFTKRWSA